MKFILILTALFTTAVLGGVSYSKNSVTPPTEVKSSVSPLDIQNHTLEGNLVDERTKALSGELLTNSKHILKATLNPKRVVYFNSVFNFNSVQNAIQELKRLEAESSEDIWLLIDSPGGSVIDGKLLTAQMEASKAHVNTVCTRFCASMAAMTHSYGHKRYSLDGSVLMYHPASAGAQGQVANMISQMTTMNRYIEKIVANVIKRSRITKEEYDRLVPYELWVDAEDSLAKGLIEGIISLNVPSYAKQVTPTEDSQEHVRRNTKFDMISPHLDLWNR